MTIKQLYTKYQIMPQLETHMLRVAGIAKLITRDWQDQITAEKCVKLCLLHDMGNMAKFQLDEKYAEWKPVQEEFWRKYGREAHQATCLILEDAGLREYRELIDEESHFYHTILEKDDYRDVSLPAVLTLYADSRVSMIGVVPLEERIVDLETRYKEHRSDRLWASKLESYVQSLTIVEVARITEADVEPFFDELLEYTI